METQIFTYPIIIKETYLDVYGHVNNAAYLTLFEEARWELITNNGYGFKKVLETGLGPVILKVTLEYLKELCLRDQIIIESQMFSYEGKIGKLRQTMRRKEEICCTAEFTFGLFDLKTRKLVLPTSDWLVAVGISKDQN